MGMRFKKVIERTNRREGRGRVGAEESNLINLTTTFAQVIGRTDRREGRGGVAAEERINDST